MKYSFSILLILLSLFACKNEEVNDTPIERVKNLPIPKFNSASAYHFVAKQVEFGPRVPNTPAHQATKNWLVSQLKAHGAKVIEQDFIATAYTGEKLKSTNIIGQYNPAAKERILLAAHWDSRHITDNDPDESKRNLPVDAADDGASGVGVLLEIARHLKTLPDYMGVDIIFFDSEDHGTPTKGDTYCLGSQYWSKNFHVKNYKANYGILLDMVGAKNAHFRMELYSMQYAKDVINKVWKLAEEMGRGNYFLNELGEAITDDHLFVNQIAGIPMIDIINQPKGSGQTFVKHWHTTNDTMENIDKQTLWTVGQVILAVIFNEAMGKL